MFPCRVVCLPCTICRHRKAVWLLRLADRGAAPLLSPGPCGRAEGSAWNMGRKSDAPRFQALGRGGKSVTRGRVLTFLFVGFLVGLGLGFVFMGTVHAVREHV